jgi:hypothetical protein
MAKKSEHFLCLEVVGILLSVVPENDDKTANVVRPRSLLLFDQGVCEP